VELILSIAEGLLAMTGSGSGKELPELIEKLQFLDVSAAIF